MASGAHYATLLGGSAFLTGVTLNYEPTRDLIYNIAEAILQNPSVVDVAAKYGDMGVLIGGAVGLAGLAGIVVNAISGKDKGKKDEAICEKK